MEARVRARLIGMLTTLALLGGALTAQAGQLSTPAFFVGAGTTVMCVATNAGTKPAEVVVTARQPATGIEIPFAISTCATLDPGESCLAQLPADTDAACFFTVKGKVKASINVYDGNTLRAALPATR
jgi:hypothetical protein